MAVTTSIVVQFSSSSGSVLTAEVDSREDGLNNGKTSFSPGNTAKFLVFKSDNVTIDSMVSSAGTLSPAGSGTYEVEEWVTFSNTAETSVSKPVASGFSYEWFGTSLGTITASETSLRVESKGVAVAKVKYQSKYLAYALASPASLNGESEFQIVVFISGSD